MLSETSGGIWRRAFNVVGKFQFAMNSRTAGASNRAMTTTADDDRKHRFARTLSDLCDQVTASKDPTGSAVEVLQAVSGLFSVCDELTDLILEMLEVAGLEAQK